LSSESLISPLIAHQPTGKPSADLFWESLDRNPGPVAAAFLFLGFVERKLTFDTQLSESVESLCVFC
jgi:hypothetical protein